MSWGGDERLWADTEAVRAGGASHVPETGRRISPEEAKMVESGRQTLRAGESETICETESTSSRVVMQVV